MIDSNEINNNIEQIYEDNFQDVYRFLICFLGNRNEAEDLAQEVFIRILKYSSRYNYKSKLSTWILSIAKHVAIDHVRRKKFTSLFKHNFFSEIPDQKNIPDQLIFDMESKKVIQAAISSLKSQHRAVVILRGINELSIRETAEVLNCSVSKVKVDYHRALKILRRKLYPSKEEVFGDANG
ncbi:RNA polymerase sigma factor [Aquibacillus kalidii]|uniref:RNA polymerase sigma factor n=1 Tax=Aquibacillus kalidii TaxID=2762597 RepID=UPI001648246E|nr:RNA polymerase sigma factor [Aquibacillus kalidii]